MDNDKRMAGSYEIIQSVGIGEGEIVIGEDKHNKDGLFFMVADCSTSDLFRSYENCLASGDYLEIAGIFAQRISETVKQLTAERDSIEVPTEVITDKDCISVSMSDSVKDKVVVIKPEILKPEYRMSVNQLMFVTGGNGAYPNARGRAVFCTGLYDKQSSRIERSDILGVMPKDKLPDWARKSLEGMEKARRTQHER